MLIIFIINSCASSKIVQQYKNPKTQSFEANKVLIIGLSPDMKLRQLFENRAVEALKKEDVRAVKSIDFFKSSFTKNKQSLEELNTVENQLLEAGFDAILFTKIIGKTSKMSFIKSFTNYTRQFQNFEDYYINNQHIFQIDDTDDYIVYTTETSLFCICSGKERELLWQGQIEIVDKYKTNKNINKYLNKLLKALKENKLLVSI